MPKCWAAPLGNCVAKISREHVVSASLWQSPTIDVVGLPWCRDTPKHVAVANLTAKILCRSHNTALSDVDSAGAKAFTSLRDAADIRAAREAENSQVRRVWPVTKLSVDGSLLERWFLKTLVNVAVSGGVAGTWRVSGEPLASTPLAFVKAAFGQERLASPLGLYAVTALNEIIESKDFIEIQTLLDDSDRLGGALFTFRGFRFLLNLAPGPVPRAAPMPYGRKLVQSDLTYRLKRINYAVRGTMSHYIQFKWQ